MIHSECNHRDEAHFLPNGRFIIFQLGTSVCQMIGHGIFAAPPMTLGIQNLHQRAFCLFYFYNHSGQKYILAIFFGNIANTKQSKNYGGKYPEADVDVQLVETPIACKNKQTKLSVLLNKQEAKYFSKRILSVVTSNHSQPRNSTGLKEEFCL